MKKRYYVLLVFISIILAISMYIIVIFNEKAIVIPLDNVDMEYRSTTKEIPDGANIENTSPYDVLAYCFDKIQRTDEFKVETSGESIAKTYGIHTTIEIKGERIVKGDNAYIYTSSKGFVSFANERFYFNDIKEVLKRDAKNIDAGTWKDEITRWTYEDILQLYGWYPKSANGYVLREDTYLNELELIKLNDGNYSIYVELNPSSEKGAYWYRREIATNAGSKTEPVFKKINIEFIIDNQFRILKQIIEEEYDIVRYGISATPLTKVTDEFIYDNIEFDPDTYNFFLNKK